MRTQTAKKWMPIWLAVTGVLLCLLLLYRPETAFAATTGNNDITLTGTAFTDSTAHPGGTTVMDANGFTYTYQITTDNAQEVQLSGCTFSGSSAAALVLPAYITEGSTTYTVVGVNGDAFANCRAYIASVTFASTYRWVGAEAFAGSPLTSVSFNEGIQEIRARAFYKCPNLTNIYIPTSVSQIGNGAFAACSQLSAIAVATNNVNYCGISGVLYNKNCDTLIQWPAALAVGSSITGECVIGSAEIPVRVISDRAFEGCTQLYRITDMYSTVAIIGEQAFYGCYNLTSVKIPSTVTRIDQQAFSNCGAGLVISCAKASAAETFAKSYGIQTSVTCTVRFYDGYSLLKTEDVQSGGSATAPVLTERSGYTLTWDKEFTNVQQNLDVHASWKQNFTVTFKDAYSGQMTEVVSYYGGSATPPVWTRKGYMLGWDSTAYTYVTKNITVNAVWLVSMTDGTIAEEKPALGDTRTINYITYQVTKTSASDPRVCVVGCTKQTLTALTIPATITFGGVKYKVTMIGVGAFRDMPKLASVTIGKNVIKIKKTAFYNCPKLKTMTVKSKKITGIGEKAFSKIYVKAKINVPNSCKTKYKKYMLDAGLSTYAKVY